MDAIPRLISSVLDKTVKLIREVERDINELRKINHVPEVKRRYVRRDTNIARRAGSQRNAAANNALNNSIHIGLRMPLRNSRRQQIGDGNQTQRVLRRRNRSARTSTQSSRTTNTTPPIIREPTNSEHHLSPFTLSPYPPTPILDIPSNFVITEDTNNSNVSSETLTGVYAVLEDILQ